MANLEMFVMDSNGAGWVDVNDLPIGEVMAIEIELATNPKPAVQLVCPVCLAPVASGEGTSLCVRHR